MASTYSNLKFQLMATGENSGTWGNVTNVNLGTAIEEAIVGSVNVAFSSADVTLTLADTNASQAARNLRLNLTGTSGANRNLTVPAIQKVYIVNNGLAHQVTVKNATGTGVVVPAGKTMYVYNDGTNVVDAITHLTSLTLGSPLPVASGGTGSNTATFSGANITALNASNISSGTIANDRTTASSANGANTIVQRDASGNFSAETITAALNGNATTATSATNATNVTGTTTASIQTSALATGTANTSTFLRGDRAWTELTIPDPIPSGTSMLFVQTSAPTGWTKSTTHDNKALRVVSGTAGSGGSVAFTTAFASQAVGGSIANTTATGTIGSTTATNQNTTATNQNTTATNQATTAGGTVANSTLTTAQIPSHNHFTNIRRAATGAVGDAALRTDRGANINTANTGGGGAHSHGFTGSSHNHTQNAHTHTQNAHTHTQNAHTHTFTGTAHNHTFTGTAINLAVQYVDVIIATKN